MIFRPYLYDLNLDSIGIWNAYVWHKVASNLDTVGRLSLSLKHLLMLMMVRSKRLAPGLKDEANNSRNSNMVFYSAIEEREEFIYLSTEIAQHQLSF